MEAIVIECVIRIIQWRAQATADTTVVIQWCSQPTMDPGEIIREHNTMAIFISISAYFDTGQVNGVTGPAKLTTS